MSFLEVVVVAEKSESKWRYLDFIDFLMGDACDIFSEI